MHGEKKVVVVTFSVAMRNSVLKQLLEGCVCLGLLLRASESIEAHQKAARAGSQEITLPTPHTDRERMGSWVRI